PAVEPLGLPWIAAPQALDALAELADDEHGQEHLRRIELLEPVQDMAVSAVSLAELRHHVRVEQKHQRSTRRAGVRGGSKSRSSPASGMASRWSFRLSGGCKSAFRKSSRCSASAERPCRAARFLSASTTSSSMFRTIN